VRLQIGTNFFLVVGLVLNIMLQAAFCVLVIYLPESNRSFTTEAVEAYKLWYNAADQVTRDGVCRSDESLTTSYHQFTIYEEAVSYTTLVFPYFTVEQGPFLCSIVVFVWSLSMCNVLQDIWVFVSSVAQIHKFSSREMKLDDVLMNDKKFALADVPTLRMAWVVFVGALQTAIAVTLMIYGALWLVSSTRNTDLFLNTLALKYIMDIDELVFQAIVTRDVHYIIQNTDALSLRSREDRMGLLRAVPLGPW